MGLNRGTIRKGKKKVISKNNDVKQILDNMDLYDFQKKAVMDTIESPPVREVEDDVEESLIQSTSLLSDDVEEVIEETVKTLPEQTDEVVEVSDEVVVEDIVEENKSKELEEVLKEEENKSDEEKKVICLDTLDVYENAKDAESKTPAKASAITRNCNGNSKRAGGLRWMYYKDYLLQENK